VLRDCLEIFNQELERVKKGTGDADRLILDSYIPADGDYVIVKKDGTITWKEIKFNKRTGKLEHTPSNMEQICRYDYNSQLVSMDKPQDPKKIIHSNNYLSFWVKQDNLQNGKLDKLAIDRYFDVLADPKQKYTKPKDREMYEYVETQVGKLDLEKLEHHRQWIQKYIFSLEELGIELSGRNYLKIFFEDEDELYVREGKRYTITKIFNKNDYNVIVDGGIMGLPNNNIGMNAKKPFMESKTRKMAVPYLVNVEEVLLQKKFFDYLMNLASAGKTNIFFNQDIGSITALPGGKMVAKNFTGYFLQVQKSKEVIIQHQDAVVDYRFKKKFSYENVLETEDREELYKDYETVEQIQGLIDEVLFSKWLLSNYFTPIEDLQLDGDLKRTLAQTRDAIFAWLYKGREAGIDKLLPHACLNMTKASINNNYIPRARKQFNLMYSMEKHFKGGKQMEQNYKQIKDTLRGKIDEPKTKRIETNEEYYFAVGQLVNYFISLNKSKDKPHSLANPFFNATRNELIKKKLQQFFIKYNYQLNYAGRRFNNLYAMICNYPISEEVNQEAIIAGYINSNLLYEPKKEEEEHE